VRIAFFTYPSAFQNVGGGEIQLRKTREYLEKAGKRVDLFDPWKSRVEDYDVLHVFSSVGDCLGLARTAKSRGVKVVTSTVLWSDWRRALHTDGGTREKADLVLRHAMKVAFPYFPSARRSLLDLSDRLFPNSAAEKDQIAQLFAISPAKIRVVPNGVDPDFDEGADPVLFEGYSGEKGFLLSVGRIEPRKNQLNLIRAVKGLSGERLVLVGDPVTGYEDYFERCRREGEGFTRFVPMVPHGSALQKSAYAACKAFVLQGWFETPGLAALEAALCGARLAVTSGGSTREYFEDTAEYLDPSSPEDIRRALRAAIAAPAARATARVRARYTWDKVAAETYVGYEEALAR